MYVFTHVIRREKRVPHNNSIEIEEPHTWDIYKQNYMARLKVDFFVVVCGRTLRKSSGVSI